MASVFTIDGNPVKDPLTFSYEERYTPFRNSFGQIIVSAYASAVATFNEADSKSDFYGWSQYGNEQPHTIVCPILTTPASTGTFAGAFIEYVSADISNGLYFYAAQFRVRHIDIQGLGVFGSI